MKIAIIVKDEERCSRSLDVMVKRCSDNKLFESSFPTGYNAGDAFIEVLSGKIGWYLREIIRLPKKWWHKTRRYKRTGKVWEPEEGREFSVIKTGEV